MDLSVSPREESVDKDDSSESSRKTKTGDASSLPHPLETIDNGLTDASISSGELERSSSHPPMPSSTTVGDSASASSSAEWKSTRRAPWVKTWEESSVSLGGADEEEALSVKAEGRLFKQRSDDGGLAVFLSIAAESPTVVFVVASIIISERLSTSPSKLARLGPTTSSGSGGATRPFTDFSAGDGEISGLTTPEDPNPV